MSEEKEIGKIIHYYTGIKVAIIKLKDTLNSGDQVHIIGHTSDFKQKITSIQIEHKKIEKATKNKTVGVKVKKHVRVNDKVYKVV